MRASETLRVVLRLFRAVLIADLVLFLAVAVFCWLAGWRTVYEYGDALVKFGIIALFAVLLTSLGGSYGRAEDFAAFSVTHSMPSDEFITRSAGEALGRWRFTLIGILAAGIAVIAGAALLWMP